MAIRRYEPWGLLSELSRELGRLSENAETGDNSSLATSDWTPAVDIREESDRYVIHVDLPGVRPEDIEVHMEGGLLSISGSRRSEATESGEGYKRIERAAGSFYRRFSLPDTADPERISARCNNGVLEVSIPKQEQTKPRRIQVEG
ncbi:Hsp20/alpha crystallin family protein [Arhodomonas sp. SL1]|uniref:Hsp20/alpha crystallin family protein n=1 Tax=Arhodomonas sp. SL1 TaxID=3425691 RepID=UPI003F8859E0